MPSLHAIMYHYVRNPEETPYKGIHAVKEIDFIDQVNRLNSHYEMASAEKILDYLKGNYQPKKDLCILTFDDGLKEHALFVTETLAKHKIQGLFFIPTACVEEGYVLPVHKNHFLLAYLPFKEYKLSTLAKLKELAPDINTEVDTSRVAATYRWDTPEVAAFKYLLNYKLERPLRNKLLKLVFEQTFGDEKEFAKSLYLDWQEAKSMQNEGMLLGGHSHTHNVLSSLSDKEQSKEINTCMSLLKENVQSQSIWTFSYPFGKMSTFNKKTENLLKDQDIKLAFTSEVGHSNIGINPIHLKRIDPKDIV